MKLVNKLINKCSKGLWHALAMLIVFIIAGPEILISMELIAIIEVLGASTFVIAYLSGLRLYLEKPLGWLMIPILKYAEYESNPYFFIPRFEHVKLMPSLLVHAIPEKMVLLMFALFMISSFITLFVSII